MKECSHKTRLGLDKRHKALVQSSVFYTGDCQTNSQF